ncbi:hypothetical protein JX265_007681 [Neoarthrinium moseri]|uniref:Uncharacterized protein n=1 Tax=Neoarthrinium moseri TaxID=1658444 RepID=A0A9P9WJ40_9PEZI|nr:uncharacterized protein JN550_003259 [Neoarthrinium moseri]KAI1855483.1 hypothetical protein JX266_000348 [Neoarthrinium moseri]KAI1866380.1 hypothetical protein JX265_007681 [Neoarthrinium moseri]KAI1873006.1 hypothetical protein JN550_003259 [Neoarthrinium moseri]
MASHSAPRAPGLHTPTQSFSDSMHELTIPRSHLDPNDKKKQKDEMEAAKSRLIDPKFDIRTYPDPLLPRETAPEKFMPQGLTEETEKHLLDVIAKTKAAQS